MQDRTTLTHVHEVLFGCTQIHINSRGLGVTGRKISPPMAWKVEWINSAMCSRPRWAGTRSYSHAYTSQLKKYRMLGPRGRDVRVRPTIQKPSLPVLRLAYMMLIFGQNVPLNAGSVSKKKHLIAGRAVETSCSASQLHNPTHYGSLSKHSVSSCQKNRHDHQTRSRYQSQLIWMLHDGQAAVRSKNRFRSSICTHKHIE